MVENIKGGVSQEFIPLSLVRKEIAKRFGMDDRTIQKYLDSLKEFDLLKPHPKLQGFKHPDHSSSLPSEENEISTEEAPEVPEIDERTEAAGAE